MLQPLSGLLVVDFTTLLPGPLATLMLSEAGAEVVKIERPGGEEMRAMSPRENFALLNAGKKSLALDLKDAKDRAHLEPLLARADILLEQFRPGVMERLGLGYEELKHAHPRLIYCSISGYGQLGPRSQEAGHDLNYIGATGLLALNPGPLDRPTVPPTLVADIAGGSFPAVINILLALRHRDQTGRGCHIDIAMTDAMFTFAWHALAARAASGRGPEPGEALLTGGSPRYALYPTADGKLVACAALEQKFWLAFTRAIALSPALVDDARDAAATKRAVAAIMLARTAEAWKPILAAADCCATIVASLEQAVRDPHFVARGLFSRRIEGEQGDRIPALPLPIADPFRSHIDEVKRAPTLGKEDPPS